MQRRKLATTLGLGLFIFNDTPPREYVRVDRKGFPAVNTGLHIHGDKDEYNDPEGVPPVRRCGPLRRFPIPCRS